MLLAMCVNIFNRSQRARRRQGRWGADQDVRQHRRMGRRLGSAGGQGQEDGRLPHVASVLPQSLVRRDQQIG